jgi:predicted ester cyclase
VVVGLGPPQYVKDTTTRRVEIYRAVNNSFELIRSHEFTTNPPYSGDPSADTELSRNIVKRFFRDVLSAHDHSSLAKIVSPDILIHPTAMPCEAGFYGIDGVTKWLGTQWKAFPDLTIAEYFTVAQGDIAATHWTARGTSKGDFLTLSPTGNIVKYNGASMYRIESDKIAEIWDARNTLSIMRQLSPENSVDESASERRMG